MDKDQAERSLAIIRGVIENTRDDLIERNWGIVWIVHSFVNFAAAASGTWIDRANLPVFWYAAPLSVAAVLSIVVALVFMSRDQGVRSYIEWQLWGIWIVFVVFTGVAMLIIFLTGTRPSVFAPIFAMNCGLCFAMMGLIFYRRFLIVGGLLLLVAIAAAAWPTFQWWLIGAAWWLAMFMIGVSAHREKLRRQQNEQRTKLL